MSIDVKVPALGESITEATLGQWLKQPGQAVAADEAIASLETDKVAIEVNAPVDGTLAEQLVKEGDTVGVGAIIARVSEGAAATPDAEKQAADAATNPAGPAETPLPKDDVHAPAEEHADLTLSPAVRRAVLEHHVDPSKIHGTGKDGRITKDDVLAAAKAKEGGAPAPVHEPEARKADIVTPAKSLDGTVPQTVPHARDGAQQEEQLGSRLRGNDEMGARHEERVKMSRLRQTIAHRLKEAQNTAALLTTFNDVDMSAVIEARTKYKDLFEKKHGIRLGFMGFFVKACALAARDIPSVNASIDGDEIIYRDYFDVSIAVSAPKGLVVPVVRNAESMSFAEIEKAVAAYGKKAKEGTLTLEEMTGGTFTISNGGVFGSLLSTPIINPPQSAVLGMHRIEERPVAVDGQVVIRPMMYLALSYDHRLVDGREAVTFLVRVKEAIEDPTRLLIDL